MASSLAAPFSLEYVRIYDLPSVSSLPEELRGQQLYSKATFVHANKTGEATRNSVTENSTSTSRDRRDNASSSNESTKVKTSGFNYSKALKAGLTGAGSSVSSRGDGKFEGGKDFAVSDAPGGRAKFVHLTPEALAPGNAERTLQDLDRLQQQAGSRGSAAAAGAATSSDRTATASDARPTAAPLPRSVQQQHAAAAAAAAKLLYDISDDSASSGTSFATPVTGKSSLGLVGTGTETAAATAASLNGLRVPEYTLRELQSAQDVGSASQSQRQEGSTAGQLEVAILLPEVSSPGEVEVWLGGGGELQLSVPGKYQLKLELPCRVVDDTLHAKWSKAKRRLTLLTKQGGRDKGC